jgi:hypothetical protein
MNIICPSPKQLHHPLHAAIKKYYEDVGNTQLMKQNSSMEQIYNSLQVVMFLNRSVYAP